MSHLDEMADIMGYQVIGASIGGRFGDNSVIRIPLQPYPLIE